MKSFKEILESISSTEQLQEAKNATLEKMVIDIENEAVKQLKAKMEKQLKGKTVTGEFFDVTDAAQPGGVRGNYEKMTIKIKSIEMKETRFHYYLDNAMFMKVESDDGRRYVLNAKLPISIK